MGGPAPTAWATDEERIREFVANKIGLSAAEREQLRVACLFLAAMGWQTALDGGGFFPTLRLCVSEMLNPFIERWAGEAFQLRRRLARVEERQAEVLHRLDRIEAGLKLVLGELGYAGAEGADAAGVR